VLCWPVIDPLGRYHYAKEMKTSGKFVQNANGWLSAHDAYWTDEAAMAEGNPTLALERGEAGPTPPVLYIQGTHDKAHPKPHRERFIAGYRKAGGRVELHLFEGMDQAFITDDPHSAASVSAIEKIIAFIHREIQ
jgi:acetyl esterase/lipase